MPPSGGPSRVSTSAARVNYWNSSLTKVEDLLAYIGCRAPSGVSLIGGLKPPVGTDGTPTPTPTWNYGVVVVGPAGSPFTVRGGQVPYWLEVEEDNSRVEFVRGPENAEDRESFVAEAANRLSEEVGGQERLARWPAGPGSRGEVVQTPVPPPAGRVGMFRLEGSAGNSTTAVDALTVSSPGTVRGPGHGPGQLKAGAQVCRCMNGWGSWGYTVQLARLEEARANLEVAREFVKVREMERTIAENHVCSAHGNGR